MLKQYKNIKKKLNKKNSILLKNYHFCHKIKDASNQVFLSPSPLHLFSPN